MYFRMMLIAIVCILRANQCCADVTFKCPSDDCANLWAASQDIGSKASYFENRGQIIKADDLRSGTVVTAMRDINVRSGPANWQKPLLQIHKSEQLRIISLDVERLSDGKTQIWVQIEPTNIHSAAAPPPRPSPTPVITVTPAAAPCLVLASQDGPSATPIIVPPTSHPPSDSDVQRLLVGRDIYCDQYGLIVHKNGDGTFNGGDTAQREGWYWLGVWLRENIPGLPKWPYQRKLTFDQVLDLLEPGKDGIFYRHPKQPPYNNPFSKEWGLSRDQLIPLVAAMGVWGNEQDRIQRLWDALPDDLISKHAFNGNWRNFLGQDGPNCGDIKKRSCDATADCSLQTDNRDCSLQVDNRDCSLQVDNRDCSAGEDTRSCGHDVDWGALGRHHINDPACETAKAAQNAAYASAKAACESAKSAQNGMYAAAKGICEGQKAAQNAAYASSKAACESAKTAQQGIYDAQKASCEAAKTAGKLACETDKAAAYQICRVSNVYSGDIIGPSAVNLFARALNKDPMSIDLATLLPATIVQGGITGESELFVNQHIIIGKSWNNRDETGDDLNNIVMLIMAKRRFPSPVSDAAFSVYIQQRRHSYGSYLGSYYRQYGDDMSDLTNRIDRGISSGWRPDVTPAAGAVRWYHRPDTGANPQLSTLYQPIIEMLLK